jgi:hypothetical protein
MGRTVQDGTGRGYHAKVDANFRLHTQSVTDTAEQAANREGDAYNINTGVITLTKRHRDARPVHEEQRGSRPAHPRRRGWGRPDYRR